MIEIKYSSDVNDMLVRLYNYMVNYNIEFTTVGAYMADSRSSGTTSSGGFYKKFIDEIDYIKELASIQPTKTIKVRTLFWIENDKAWNVASENTEVVKSFSESKLNERISWFNGKTTNLAKTEIEVIESTNLEYLTN